MKFFYKNNKNTLKKEKKLARKYSSNMYDIYTKILPCCVFVTSPPHPYKKREQKRNKFPLKKIHCSRDTSARFFIRRKDLYTDNDLIINSVHIIEFAFKCLLQVNELNISIAKKS